MNIKVSIIIPNYNHALYLKQRIDSVLNQTYQNFELIILDDCSTDKSVSVLENYQNHPQLTQLLINETNSGSTFKQWAKGIEFAKGEYIWIAESDDFAEPTFLATCIDILEQNSQIGLVYCDSKVIENGKVIGRFKDKNRIYYPETDWDKNHWVNGVEEIEIHLINSCTIYNVSAVLFRKKCIEKTIPIIIDFKYAGDWLCYLLIALESELYYIAESLNNYRSHENNTTKKSGLNYNGIYERIKVRYIFKEKIGKSNTKIRKKIKKLNLMELKVVMGGFLRLRINIFDFFKVSKYYI